MKLRETACATTSGQEVVFFISLYCADMAQRSNRRRPMKLYPLGQAYAGLTGVLAGATYASRGLDMDMTERRELQSIIATALAAGREGTKTMLQPR